jgi:hypothetical protein
MNFTKQEIYQILNQKGPVYLHGADLQGADLQGADLYEADLTEADLRGANLAGANLNRARMQGANLAGANLTNTNLGTNGGAGLFGAKYSKQTIWPAGFTPDICLVLVHDNNFTLQAEPPKRFSQQDYERTKNAGKTPTNQAVQQPGNVITLTYHKKEPPKAWLLGRAGDPPQRVPRKKA